MVSAAILVGGAARRFGGRDKSALVVGGRTILERQLAELSRVADDLLLVGAPGREPAGASAVAGLRVVPDRVEGGGPLAGLEAALASARHEIVFVLACDMPFVTAALVAHLIALATRGAGRPDVVVPVTDRGYHPVCAVYRRTCRTLVARHLEERRLALNDLLDGMSAVAGRVRTVTRQELEPFGDPDRLLANVNTPSEYADLEALQDHRR